MPVRSSRLIRQMLAAGAVVVLAASSVSTIPVVAGASPAQVTDGGGTPAVPGNVARR